jgi:acetolactate synthase I/II/III large subunit
MTCGELLVDLLREFGVEMVFGIPGVHTVELYRGLPATALRHITPRHEQGAGFMADGYARVSGKPGVCFIITGPGMTNIMTAMAQAYADSIPMLVISSVNRTYELGMGGGRLHELPSQRDLIAGVSAFSHTLLRPDDLPEVLSRAYAVFDGGRPRPVHIEIPLDVITAAADHVKRPVRARVARPVASATAIAAAAQVLAAAKAPLLLLGGGTVDAGDAATRLAELLDAPTAVTINAKGVLPYGHPLALGSNQSLPPVRALAAQADVVLAIGTELGETDYDSVFDGGFDIGGRLIRIDIDPLQVQRNFAADIAIVGDAGAAIAALCEALARTPQREHGPQSPGSRRAAAARRQLQEQCPTAWSQQFKVLQVVQETLPDVIIAGDSTQPVYSGNYLYEARRPRSWFNSSTGYGTLGYGLPAAIGARLAAPQRAVVALVGDGGIQFTLAELGSAIEAGAPIIVLLWNNRGYGEIKRYMQARGIEPVGVDIYTPDFQAIARGFGCEAGRVGSFHQLQALLRTAAGHTRPTVIEIMEDAPFLTS